jgi:hypothetical protein
VTSSTGVPEEEITTREPNTEIESETSTTSTLTKTMEPGVIS